MNKQKIYDYLKEKNIEYEITEHKAVYNMEELAEIKLPHHEADAKNLFVRDDKRQNYYLITVKGEKRVNLKDFRRENGTRPLTFASPEELSEIMGLIPGAVTPLGLLNDKNHRVKFYLDKDFEDMDFIGVHPNDNTATVFLSFDDLRRIIEAHGNSVVLIDFSVCPPQT